MSELIIVEVGVDLIVKTTAGSIAEIKSKTSAFIRLFGPMPKAVVKVSGTFMTSARETMTVKAAPVIGFHADYLTLIDPSTGKSFGLKFFPQPGVKFNVQFSKGREGS